MEKCTVLKMIFLVGILITATCLPNLTVKSDPDEQFEFINEENNLGVNFGALKPSTSIL